MIDISAAYGKILNWYFIIDGGKKKCNVRANCVSVGWTVENFANSFPFGCDS
jgi:hypothetical protein